MKSYAFLIVMCSALISGCNTLGDVKDELGKGGFALWYPAEAGIEPGQIWMVDNSSNRRIKQQRTPPAIKPDQPVPAEFQSLKETVDASSSLDTKFTNQILGNAGDMAALLKAGGVKSVELNFGKTEIQRMTMGDLRSADIRKQLPTEYLSDLQKVDADNRNYVVIAAVVRASGMKYIFKCEDSTQLQAKAPEISKAVSADFNLKVISKTEAEWSVPDSKPLVIGILPVYGKDLGFDQKDLTQRLQAKIRVSDEILKSASPASATIRFDDLR